jgi:2-keto-4-pentenoate hydratase/2-oxohepta-3-ene-1,7-dioic acid hydratase in catechol pathway
MPFTSSKMNRYGRFKIDGIVFYGKIEGDSVRELAPGFPEHIVLSSRTYRLEGLKILAPVIPSKIIAVGLNYQDHAKELNMPIPDEPVIFMKPSTSVIGPEEDIIYPSMTSRLDYEAELAVVIKDRCFYFEAQDAERHILGYTCFNDVTARDLQKKDGQWTRSKSFDTFSPIGPFIVDGIDPRDLKIELYLNGTCRQSSRTSNLIFKVNVLVSFISKVMTLLPGDVITTGTPSGVGPMKKGDKVEVRIENLSPLTNYVV